MSSWNVVLGNHYYVEIVVVVVMSQLILNICYYIDMELQLLYQNAMLVQSVI